MSISSFFNKIISDPIKAVTIVITLASAITAAIPNPATQGVSIILHKVLDVLALNIGENSQQ